MATFELTAYEAENSPGSLGGVRIRMGIGKDGPMPPRKFTADTTDDALANLDAYRMEGRETSKPMAVSIRLVDGRAPNGFKAATTGMPYLPVNCGEDVTDA